MLHFALLGFFLLHGPLQIEAPIELVPESVAPHPEAIVLLTLGLKGKVVYTADAANSLRAWDLKQGKFLWETDPQPGFVKKLALEVSKNALAVCEGAPAYSLVDLKDGSDLKGGSGVPVADIASCLAFDPRGRWVWLGFQGNGVGRLIPGNTRGWSKRKTENGGTWSLALDPKAKRLAVGGADGSVRFFDPSSAKRDEGKVFDLHKGRVTALAFGPKGKLLAAGAEDGALVLVDARKAKTRKALEGHEASICALAFDPRGRWLVSGDTLGRLLLWDLKEGGHPAAFLVEAQGPVAGIGFLDKGKALVTNSGGKEVQLWDLSAL